MVVEPNSLPSTSFPTQYYRYNNTNYSAIASSHGTA